MTQKPSPLPLPGYGLPIHWTPAPCSKTEMEARMENGESRESMFRGPPLFTSAWHLCAQAPDDDVRMPLVTILERNMLDFMNSWTDAVAWEQRIMDPKIAEHWHAKQRGERGIWDWSFSKETLEYVIQELRYKARIFKETGLISLSQGDVVKSDVAISKELKERLKVAVATLENDPLVMRRCGRVSRRGRIRERELEGVVDVVDPAYHAVLYGETRVIEDGVLDRISCLRQIGAGSVIPMPEGGESLSTLSGKTGPNTYEYRSFYDDGQLLPCDVDISGDVPRILTYINNIHPAEHAPLYAILEEILARVIPAWNMTLAPLRAFDFNIRVKCDGPDYGELEEWVRENGPERGGFENEEEFDQALLSLYMPKQKGFYRPHQVSEEFKEPIPQSPTMDLKTEYKNRGLQIVVRMRSFYLTRKRPYLSIGCMQRHLEGIPNDHICAVANYYYDVDNVDTGEQAEFSQPEKASPTFKKTKVLPHYSWFFESFGLEQWGSSSKRIGTLNTPEGRLITFPNLLFQAQRPLKLIDETKNGHCKILTLLLVDPNIRLISSAIVPCQQYDWWVQEVIADKGGLGRLPYELRMEITKYIQRFWGERHYSEGRVEEQQDGILFKERRIRYCEGGSLINGDDSCYPEGS